MNININAFHKSMNQLVWFVVKVIFFIAMAKLANQKTHIFYYQQQGKTMVKNMSSNGNLMN